MKYYEVRFTISCSPDVLPTARDVLAALSADAGFESFEDTDSGLTGYAQQALFDEALLRQVLSTFPLPSCQVAYTLSEAEDRDWNEVWEHEGFAPIIVGSQCIIHDGRHLEDADPARFRYAVEIDARLAFGTGTHETTRLMLSFLLDMDLTNRRVLDCGTGTGILAIAALKMGARDATGYDIDEWSADNARHNAVINGIDSRFTSLLGDATLLDGQPEGAFHIVMANINRNILLSDLPRFRRVLAPGGRLLLSGFYSDDIPLLQSRATTLGLTIVEERTDNRWAAIALEV